jgi:hypothetical protein
MGPAGVTFINPGDDPRNKAGVPTRQGSDGSGLKRLVRFCSLQPNQTMELLSSFKGALIWCGEPNGVANAIGYAQHAAAHMLP